MSGGRLLEIVDHQPSWAASFDVQADGLRELLGETLAAVHHVGSTSVPGLAAKPIVDMLLVTPSMAALDAQRGRVEAQGWLWKGEFGIPGRRFCILGGEQQRSHHMHAYEVGHGDIHRNLAFRDYLRAHPAQVAQYQSLKHTLVETVEGSVERYQQGKADWIREAVARAVRWSDAAQPEGCRA